MGGRNDIWLVGDGREMIGFDAAHDHEPIVDGIASRSVRAIVLTHGHDDHLDAAVPLRDAVDAPILIHLRGSHAVGRRLAGRGTPTAT